MISIINGVRRDGQTSGQISPGGLEAAPFVVAHWAPDVYPRLKTAAAVDRESFDSGLEAALGLMKYSCGDAAYIGGRADIIHQSSAHTQRRNVLCTQRFGRVWF
jgi:hypothetical protein